MKNELKDNISCNCLNLRRAAQAITRVYDKHLEPSGIKVSQYSLLKSIAQAEPVNVSDLAVKVRLDRTTLVRNLKPLEEKGLISDLSKEGSRNRQLTLSESGKKTLIEAIPLWEEAQNSINQFLGPDDLSTLLSLLSKIENLDK